MTPPASAAARSAQPLRRTPPAPRRVSGPAHRPRVVSAPASPALATSLGRLVDHHLLDRLIRGRAWIGIVAFALFGIVTMQVALLKLNTGIGRSIERATTLQRENALLGAQVSQLQAGARITAQAAQAGMVYDPAGDVRYLSAGPSDAMRATLTLAPSSASVSATSNAGSRPAASVAPTTTTTAASTPATGTAATAAGLPPNRSGTMSGG